MSLTAQTNYGKVVVAKRKETLIGSKLFNENYRGDANGYAVMIPVTTSKTASAYDKSDITNNSVGTHSNGWAPMLIDKDYYVSDYIDKFDAASLPYNVVADELETIATGLAEQQEEDGISCLVNGVQGLDVDGDAYGSTDPRYGKTGTTIASGALLSAADVYTVLTTLGATLTKKKVPLKGRYAIVDPDVYAAILDNTKAIRQGDLSQELVADGVVAQLAGFNIYTTNLLPTTDSVATGIIAGHPNFATRAEAFVSEPHFVDGEGDANVVGGSFAKARIVYAHGVADPEAFVAWTYTTA